MRNHLPSLVRALLLALALQPAQASDAAKPLLPPLRHVTEDPVLEEEFLRRRAEDIRTGREPEFQPFLERACQSANAEVRVWGLARLVEAGDLSRYPDLARELIHHVRDSTRPQAAWAPPFPKSAIGTLPQVLHPSSPFYESLAKTIRASPTREVTADHYVVWCYNTLPNQRELIFEIAGKIQSPGASDHPMPDPWDDPRFWILTDWALAWGQPEDFKVIPTLIPHPKARKEFQKIAEAVLRIPGFFTCENQSPLADRVAPQPSPAPVKRTGNPVDFEYYQIKAKKMPAPPAYPGQAKARRLMTTLEVQLIVDPEGEVCGARTAPGPFLAFFAPTALEYASRMTFEPAKLNGQPQTAKFVLRMPFRLR